MEVHNCGSSIVNNYVYKAPDGYVLVDGGYPKDYPSFCKKLDALGIKVSDIKYLFLTHSHDDHLGFVNELFQSNPNIIAYMSEGTFLSLQRGDNLRARVSSFGLFISTKLVNLFMKHDFPTIEERFLPNCRIVSEGYSEEAEKALNCRILATAGHTKCSMSLLFEDGTMICGDATMKGVASHACIPAMIEDLDAFKATWERLITLNPTTLLSGHGAPISVSELQTSAKKVTKLKLYGKVD